MTLVGMIILDLIFFLTIWPDWKELKSGAIPQSRYMSDYQVTEQIRWYPLKQQLPRQLTRPFIIAEDSRFYEHPGFDRQAIRDAMRINWQQRRWVYGASTISQQTAKNLFLTHDRSLHRKWHELVMTLALERNLSKDRILSLYLNIAEFGPGIFGVEAASRHYFGKSFLSLGPREAAELAASLPSPRRHNPNTRTRFFQTKRNRIVAVLNLPPEAPASSRQIELILPPEEPDSDDEGIELSRPEKTLEEADLLGYSDAYLPISDDVEANVTTDKEDSPESEHGAESETVAKDHDIELNEEFMENFDPSSDFD